MFKRKIKILEILNTVNIGGAENMILNLIENIDNNKYEVNVLLLGDSPFYDVLVSKNIIVSKSKIYSSLHDMKFIRNIIDILRKINPDILHAHIWKTCFFACLAGAILNKPVISTFHSNYSMETRKERCMLKIIYALSRYLVFVSDYQKKFFNIVDKDNKVIIIKNGMKSQEITHKIHNMNKQIRIISVSNLRPIKGLEYLLYAIKTLSIDHDNIKLYILGEGQEYNNLKLLCAKLGIENLVSFEGYRSNVSDYLMDGDFFISSSLSETTSIAILEAMSFGIPVVATDVGGTPEIINDLENGLLVQAKDSEAIASSLKMLIENKRLYENISLNNINCISGYYNVKRMSEEYEDLYNNVVNIYV